MKVDRAHEIRIIARPKSPNTVAAVRKVVADTLGEGWQVQRVTPKSRLVLIRGRSEHPVSTEPHARDSHEAAVTLARTGRFVKIEADIPIRGYAEEERVEEAAGAFAPPLKWVHDILGWEAALAAMPAAVRGGDGIRIGHPDTGYTDHPNLGMAGLDLNLDRDVIDGDNDARDDLEQHPLWPLPFPGHGTATSSVIVGHGPPAVGIEGLAPEAKLVPIRATESVVQVFDSDVAKAVAHARLVGCHVISMSLGGKGFFGLKEEIQRAVDNGIIVMAAAGNYVRFVTAPASYDNCLAVAATGPNDSLWDGSSRGRAVDVSMPGAEVYNARFTDEQAAFRRSGQRDLFAVAHLAAAAALWLARHGRDNLIGIYGARNIQAAFLAVLRWPGVCVVPPTGTSTGASGGSTSSPSSPHPYPTPVRSARWLRSATPSTTLRAGSPTPSTPSRFWSESDSRRSCMPPIRRSWPSCWRSMKVNSSISPTPIPASPKPCSTRVAGPTLALAINTGGVSTASPHGWRPNVPPLRLMPTAASRARRKSPDAIAVRERLRPQ